MTDAEMAVLEAARQYAEALKQSWNADADDQTLSRATSDLIFAAKRLVPQEEWEALHRRGNKSREKCAGLYE